MKRSTLTFSQALRKIVTQFSVLNALCFLSFLGSIGCVHAPTENSSKMASESLRSSESSPSGKISILAFHLDNLYDETSQQGERDFAFQPFEQKGLGKETARQKAICLKKAIRQHRKPCLMFHWDTQAVEEKLRRISNLVLQSHSKGPDILLLSGIENQDLLNRLNQGYFKEANYQTAAITERANAQGLRLAILSRLPMAEESRQIHFASPPKKKARGFAFAAKARSPKKTAPEAAISNELGTALQTQLLAKPSLAIHVTVIELPALPSKQHKLALGQVNNLRKKLGPNDLLIVGGDFNIGPQEDLQNAPYKNILSPTWEVAHLMGCKACRGTSAPQDRWAFTNSILFSKSFRQHPEVRLLPLSVQVLKNHDDRDFQREFPERFSPGPPPKGVSNHFPIYAEIQIN